MNEKFLNKRFTILGLGISGIASLNYLLQSGAKIFVSDTRQIDSLNEDLIKKLTQNKKIVDFEFGLPHSERCLQSDYLLVSPGISPQEAIIQKAKSLGVCVLTELELATQMMSQYICITGTNGKSTVSSWLSFVLESPLCGNIGIPCLQVLESSQESESNYVLEVSSYQLAHSNNLKPKIAAITNVTPDHISWHGSWQEYLSSKIKITQKQDSSDWLILPDQELFHCLETQASVLWFALSEKPGRENSIFVNPEGEIQLKLGGKTHIVCSVDELPLPGKHNLENAMLVIAAAYLAGLSIEQIKERLLRFGGLEHRVEFVREIKDKQKSVKFYNDSKSTNPESSIVALKAFPGKPIIWLAGGRDKMTDLKEMCECADSFSVAALLYGEAKDRFYEALKANEYKGLVGKFENLADALEAAKIISDRLQESIILFSPACASFDQFKNFEERGKYFKGLVG